MAQSTTQKVQSILGVKTDGVWGPNSQDALNAEIAKTGDRNPVLAKIQALIGASPDGQWGPKSQKALNKALKGQGGTGAASGGNGPFSATASTFADPADVAAFNACKAKGNTDGFCFGKGDNGIGAWGTDTTSVTKAMVAVHEKDAFARWGGWAGAAHRRVRVTIGSKSVLATVEDKLGTKGRIDLNPGALAKLGLTAGHLWPCTWEWVV
jgi:hypothetical protein